MRHNMPVGIICGGEDNEDGLRVGAEGRSRTDTGSLPTVFETVASTIPPLRHSEKTMFNYHPSVI